MKLQVNNQTPELENSKLFGDAYLPDSWLEEDVFGVYEFFVAQINLSELSSKLLPSSGYLYFFIDAIDFVPNKMRAVVRYFNGEPDAYTDFNEGCFEEDLPEYLLKASDLGDILFEEVDDNFVKLLSIPAKYFDFLNLNCNSISFECDKEKLKNQDFSLVKLKFN